MNMFVDQNTFLENKNVLYVIPYPRFFSQHQNVGGHVAHAYGITSELAKAGYHVHILMEEEISLMKGDGIKITTLPLEKSSLLRRIPWGARLVRCIRDLAANESPGFCYVRYSSGFQNWLPALKKALGDIPLVLEVNSFASQKRQWMSLFEGRFLSAADYIIVISESLYHSFDRLWGEKLTAKTFVVPNGVEPNRFTNWQANLNRGFGDIIKAGYAGLIESWYGLDDMIKGFLKVRERNYWDKDLELHFYGDGPYRETLIQRYRSHPSIIFHGAQPFESMPEIIGGLDVLINSDSPQKSYSSPIKIFEYMSSGRPVLSTRTKQTEYMLDNERFGWLYEVGDPESFAEVFAALVNSPQQAKDRCVKARRYVENNHTWKHRLATILNKIADPVPDKINEA